jgi:hypothetical protein
MKKLLPPLVTGACKVRISTVISVVLVAVFVFSIFYADNFIKNDEQRFIVKDAVKNANTDKYDGEHTFPFDALNVKFSDSEENALSNSGIPILHTQPQTLNKNNSATEWDNLADDEPLPPHRLCRVKINPLKNRRVHINEPIGVPYQCTGPPYERFSKRLMKLISNPSKYGKDPKEWGRRSLPLPPNGTVMFFGNSHTRQVFQSLMCQYQKEIISANPLLRVDSKGSGVWDVRLQKNITVFGVFNVPHVYSPRWTDLLSVSLNHSLDSIDVIVLGRFNGFAESKRTTFAKLMKIMTAGTDADFEGREPPDVEEVSKVYSGPILALSMFAHYDMKRARKVSKKIKKIQESDRINILAIDSRKYVQVLGECATDKSAIVSTCSKDFKSPKKRGMNGHRCVGEHGGHPDLVAWDIVEEFHRIIGKPVPLKM